MNPLNLHKSLLELIRRTSVSLPPDVAEVINTRRVLEVAGSRADLALTLVASNIHLARQLSAPICQDTGTISFYVHAPINFDSIAFTKASQSAVAEATKLGYLRQNSVDSITGKNSGDNLGPGSPVIHIHHHDSPTIDVRLILKGGGCENMSTQFSLPMKIDAVTADRDLDGVRKCILEAVWQAQGKGCGPGFLGVCIGGDRASGYAAAKEQLLRLVDDINTDPVLAELEARILDESNTFMIGPMGFGGSMTIGGCKITKLNRLPASFFVSVAYMCWAFRRRGFVLDSTGTIDHWLYENDSDNSDISSDSSLDSVLGSAKQISAPLDELTARSLHAGDIVLLTGVLHTGRDEVHKFLHKGGDIPSLKGATIYHCGPVIIDKAGERKVIAAGPTTSIREEPYQADVIKNYGVRAVIGKGGMGSKTLAALREHGCVYLHAVGGAAQIYAKCIERVLGVHMLDRFGSPEAVWELQVKDFPVVVTMDSHGVSLHEQVERDSRSNLVKSLM